MWRIYQVYIYVGQLLRLLQNGMKRNYIDLAYTTLNGVCVQEQEKKMLKTRMRGKFEISLIFLKLFY